MDDLLDEVEGNNQNKRQNNANEEDAQTSMAQLERKRQDEARAFSKGILASLAGSSGGGAESEETNNLASRKRSAPANGHNSGDNGVDGPSSSKQLPVVTVKIEENENAPAEEEDVEDNFARLMQNSKSVKTHIVDTKENCNHEVCFPFDQEYTELLTTKTEKPAKTYPFKLDPFQRAAIHCLDNNQSVLVSAHTSAGKTVVALYAIALAFRSKQRVIYTSPIKALSNQKYRELSDEFEDVGLMTGDVTLNPNASCLVMTTEILRSMLYRGTEIIREVGWVIFDEIHYMRDKERGVVWEETIILLPPTTHFVFLSATIPNARQFAEWICYLHRQPCNVIYTNTRPVPLQHLVFPAGADGLYEVVDTKGNFRQDNYQKAMGFLAEAPGPSENIRGNGRRSIGGGGGGDSLNKSVVKIIRTIRERDMLPCIIFSFSRKECEMYATNVKQMDFNDEEEKHSIREIFKNAVDLLSDEDRDLPQIKNVLPYLLRGIGIHHSGQLPIMKEIVEILFGEGLIKTLFATETFSMGVNMPAKTVLFTSNRKFDGTTNRAISSGEYIQMSGRAGRRGKDDKGLVILMMDQQMTAEQMIQLMKGNSDPLNSQYRLTYNMVLNLLRVPDINPEFMLEKSFHQWQNYSSLPSLHQEMLDKKSSMKCCKIDQEYVIEAFYNIEKQIDELKKSIKEKVLRPKNAVPFFQSGRMLKLKHFDKDYDWGTLIKWEKSPNPLDPISSDMIYIVEVAVMISRDSERFLPGNLGAVRPPPPGEKGVLHVLPFTFECVTAISTIRLKLPHELKSSEARAALAITLAETKKRFANIIPELDPIEHMKVNDSNLKTELKQLRDHEARYKEHPLRTRPDFDGIYQAYMRKLKLEEEYKQAKKKFEDGRKLLQREELQCRKRVLRRMGYATDDDTITDKGRVACELSSADELLLTEMIFTGAFTTLEPEEAAALLTCFVFEERAPNAKINDKLAGYLRNMQGTAKRIAKVCTECKLEIDEEKYVEQFGPGMMDVVYNWCRGATFSSIMENTQLFEGSIIRCMRRLDELLTQMIGAAKSLGDKTLEEKFNKSKELLKRDIVFSASLYL